MTLKILGIIPARFASTRFPGKPLVMIAGKTMIQRTYEQALKAKCLQKIVVATDDVRILNHVVAFGGNAVMTSENHQSGTDRCYETLQKLGSTFDYIINIQGDEPFIQPEMIDELAACLDISTELATLVKKIEQEVILFNPNSPKVVFNTKQEALYFSRQAIPFLRGFEPSEWLHQRSFYKHIGIYAYRSDILAKIIQLPISALEETEKLEQLRWLENGYKIKVAITEYESMGIDSPEDLLNIKAEDME